LARKLAHYPARKCRKKDDTSIEVQFHRIKYQACLISCFKYMDKQMRILLRFKIRHDEYFVAVLPRETSTGFAQAGDGFAIRFPVVSKA
jgi:hypothetical protein